MLNGHNAMVAGSYKHALGELRFVQSLYGTRYQQYVE